MKNILRLFLALIFSQVILAQVSNFEGIQYSNERPPDPVIAVSNDYIVQAVNKKLAVFNKSGTKLFEQSFSVFFSNQSPPSSIFDPKVAYDQYNDRFIFLAAGTNTGGGNSNYMLAVTQNADPTGSWYKYKLNAEDQNLTQYDIDFPGLGYDEEAIYLTSHQYDNVQVSYYPKITILNKSEVYSGTITYRKDFKDFPSSGAQPEKLKPMRKFGSSSGYYLVNTNSPDQIRIWKIENPLLPNVSLNVASTLTLGGYTSITEATQKGTTNTVDIGDYSISDVVCIAGYLYGAYTVQNTTSNGSMIVYFKINTANNFDLLINGKIETANKYYYYPVLHPDNEGNIVFAFNKSSSNDYIGVAWTIRYVGNSDIEPIKWLKQGTTWYYNLLNTRNRWGDYCGVALDPANGHQVWICGEWAFSNTQWSTWIGEISTGQNIDFFFTNTIYDENTGILNANAGGTITVNSDDVNSGEPLPLETGNPYLELTNNERFTNWNSLGFTYKHNHWNSDLDRKFLSNDFIANALYNDQRAYFKSLNYTKIETRLEGQLITNKGAGNFQDPWYVLNNGTQPGDYWKDFTSFYEPNGKDGASEKGVFLNQGITPQGQWQPPYYSVKVDAVQDIPLFTTGVPTGNGRTHKFYFQNWSGTNVNFQNSNALETTVVFTSDGAVAQANLKGTQLSNSTNAYSNNSQRKFLRTTSTYPYIYSKLHSVYESMGRIWYETSTDNGATWIVMNNGKPLSNHQSKCPSISPFLCYEGDVLITFQEYYYDDDFIYRNRVLRYNPIDDLITQDLSPTCEFAGNNITNPVIQANENTLSRTHILLVWEVRNDDGGFGGLPAGLYYLIGKPNAAFTGYEWTNNGEPQILPYTDANSYNPSLSQKMDHYEVPTIFHLVWEQRTSSTASVLRYLKINAENNYTVSFPYYNSNLSSGSGFQKNSAPSLVTLNNGVVKVVWQGARQVMMADDRTTYKTNAQSQWEYKTIYKDLSTGIQKTFGTKTNLPTINKLDNNSEFFFAYSEQSDLAGKVVLGSDIRTINQLDAFGKDVQISNGSTLNSVKANLFKSTSLPFYFSLSTNLEHVTPKKNNLAILSGREGIVFKDSAQFYFAVGDVLVDNIPVTFKSLSDTFNVNTIDQVNEFLETEPFTLSDNSIFYYSVQYGVTDSSAAALQLTNNRSINFRVELLDFVTGSIIGSFDDVVYSENSFYQYDNIAYQVNTAGIGNTQVKLRLLINSSGDFDYSLTERFAEESVLGKNQIKQLNLDGSGLVKEYALYQNYPNPFNPSTTIRYQIPQDGIVTLKIYDILGSEVATLVNEEKVAGKYEANFNASTLASGVYIYKIQAGSFINSKKMILLK